MVACEQSKMYGRQKTNESGLYFSWGKESIREYLASNANSDLVDEEIDEIIAIAEEHSLQIEQNIASLIVDAYSIWEDKQ